MASTAIQLATLANDPQFKQRVLALFVQEAGVVYSEAPKTITAISLANPGVITSAGHGLTIGATAFINVSGSNSTPSIDGVQSIYVLTANTLRTTVNVTGAGTTGTFTIPARKDFAKFVMSNTAGVQSDLVMTVANRTNVAAANTTFDFPTGRIVSDVTDAAILAQLASDWSMMAGV